MLTKKPGASVLPTGKRTLCGGPASSETVPLVPTWSGQR